MRPLLVVMFVSSLVLGTITASAGEESRDDARGASVVLNDYPFAATRNWLPQLKTVTIKSNSRYERTSLGLERARREIRTRFPDLKDPDPLKFTQLLPIVDVVVEDIFDHSRLRTSAVHQTPDKIKLSSNTRVWDGHGTFIHERSFQSSQNGYFLSPQPDHVISSALQYVNCIRSQPGAYWWNGDRKAIQVFEQQFGHPSDYILVGRETFHDVECDVYLQSIGNQSDRYYVGVRDGRWQGAKVGIIAFTDPEQMMKTFQATLEEFLGEKVPPERLAEVTTSLRQLPQDRKVTWCKLLYDRLGKNYPPVFESWFSDFRDLGHDRWVPFREDFLFFQHENQKSIFLETKRVTTITEILLDQQIDDELFKVELTDGARVTDENYQPPLRYKFKKEMSEDEWQQIVKDSQKAGEHAKVQQEKVDKLLGQPAPALPSGEWLNSKPLTWTDLKGKIVILKFWSIGCGPCYGEISALERGLADAEADSQQTSPPLVIIGVHLPAKDLGEIQSVLNKYELKAPICIDQSTSDDHPWGEFFAACEVEQMPTSIAVDENGQILAHGSLSDILTAIRLHREKQANKK